MEFNINLKTEIMKKVKGIYLDGSSISELEEVGVDKGKLARVFFPVDIAEIQTIQIFTLKEDGSLRPRYMTVADGEEGFPLVFSDAKIKEPRNRIFLTDGDVCALYFFKEQQFTGLFTIPSKGKA